MHHRGKHVNREWREKISIAGTDEVRAPCSHAREDPKLTLKSLNREPVQWDVAFRKGKKKYEGGYSFYSSGGCNAGEADAESLGRSGREALEFVRNGKQKGRISRMNAGNVAPTLVTRGNLLVQT